MDQVSQVREKIDIVALISEYVTLKKAGRNFKGLCPFHGEKTPSFVVSSERQIWHCFGCQKGGDCFTFLMEYEHIDFGESLRILAKKAGIELVKTQFEKGISSKRELFYEINHLASEFYHYVLTKHPAGKKALSYLTEERNIKPQVIKTYQLGYAPKNGRDLTGYLLSKKGYKKEDILEVGLGFYKNGRLNDFFTDRIIFPLIDHRDNVVGFSARALSDTQMPKYVNTRETLIYHKGSHLFGIHVAKAEIKKANKVLVMEGEFDVISAFQEGFGYAVAIKGTALTENQVKVLARFTNQIALCFDKDTAGEEALMRSIPILEKQECTITVVPYENGKDPHESIHNNAVAFKKAVKNEISVYEYILAKALSETNPVTSEGKRIISSKILPFFVGIQNEIVKEHFLKRLSESLDTSYESIVREASKKSVPVVVRNTKPVVSEKREREEILEEYLLSLILQSEKPQEYLEGLVGMLSEFMPKERAYQKMMHYLLEYCLKIAQFEHALFSQQLPSELLSVYDTSMLLPLPQFEDKKLFVKEVEKTARELRKLYIRSHIKSLTKTIEQKEEKGEVVEKEEKKLSYLIESLKD